MRNVVNALALALAACGGSAPPPAHPLADLAAAAARAGADEPEPDLTLPVTAISVTGLDTYRAAKARAAIATAIGVVVDPLQLRRDEAAIWDLGGIDDVAVRAVADAGGVALFFDVRQSPRLASITIHGAGSHSEVVPETELGLAADTAYDPARIASARDRLVDAYRNNGWVFADVTWSVTRSSRDASVNLTVEITEGKRVTIRSIHFSGEKRFTESELAAVLEKGIGAKIGVAYGSFMAEYGVYYLNSAYFDVGHVDVRVAPAQETFDATAGEVDLVFAVDEGAEYKVGKLTGEKEDLKVLGLKTGDVFSRSKLQAGVDAVAARHRAHGATNPQVTPLSDVHADKHTIDLKIQVD